VRLLFVGSEVEYFNALESREDGPPFSLFFCPALQKSADVATYDAIIMPALRFLALPSSLHTVPIMASGPISTMAECFEYGCDDYLLEPWTQSELYIRVVARMAPRLELERGHVQAKPGTITGPLGSARLSHASYRVLVLLCLNRGSAVPRQAIACCVCPDANMVTSEGRSIDMRMARLRATLRAVGATESAGLIQGHRGCYSFMA